MARPSAQIVEVEVHGLDQLERDWPVWERRTEHALQECAYGVATLTMRVTQLRVPVLTGAFRGSLTVERGLVDGRPAARVSEGEGLAYGRWLEFGRRRTGRGPKGGRYLPPTARREKREFKKRLGQTTQKEINQYPWPR